MARPYQDPRDYLMGSQFATPVRPGIQPRAQQGGVPIPHDPNSAFSQFFSPNVPTQSLPSRAQQGATSPKPAAPGMETNAISAYWGEQLSNALLPSYTELTQATPRRPPQAGNVQPTTLTGPGPRMANLPAWQNQLPDSTALTSPYPPVGPPPPAIGTTPGAGAGGYTRLPDADIYRKQQATPGFDPNFPDGKVAGTTNYAIPGAVGLGGSPAQAQFQGLPTPGGTVSYYGEPVTANMSQQEATAYNVSKLNSQIEALRSLREARNPGITTGGAARAFGDLVSVGTPGGSFGDDQIQAEQARSLMGQAGDPRNSMTGKQRQAMMQSGMGLAANQTPGVTRLPAMGGGAGIDPYQAGQLSVAQQKLALDQKRLGLDYDQAGMTRDKNKADVENQYLQRELDDFVKRPVGQQNQMLAQLQSAMKDEIEKNGESPKYRQLETLYDKFAKVSPPPVDYMDMTAKP